jgi:hypothetical protein
MLFALSDAFFARGSDNTQTLKQIIVQWLSSKQYIFNNMITQANTSLKADVKPDSSKEPTNRGDFHSG